MTLRNDIDIILQSATEHSELLVADIDTDTDDLGELLRLITEAQAAASTAIVQAIRAIADHVDALEGSEIG